jgi:chemotaxis protein MotB
MLTRTVRNLTSITTIVVLAGALAGCTTIQKGAAIGGAAGAAVGALYGAEFVSAINAGEGALIGAAGGSVIGGLIGADMGQQDVKDLERQLENLRGQMEAKCGQMKEQMAELQNRVDALEKDSRMQQERMKELSRLEDELKQYKDIADSVDAFKKTSRGLELTLLGDTLFRPGAAKLSEQGRRTLDSLASAIKEKFPEKEISIEGHTDNAPIKRSGWRSNWELGAARSQEALHYLIDVHDLKPGQLSATTFGEFRPVADNATDAGRSQNRRAVIVVLSQPVDVLSHQAAAQ